MTCILRVRNRPQSAEQPAAQDAESSCNDLEQDLRTPLLADGSIGDAASKVTTHCAYASDG